MDERQMVVSRLGDIETLPGGKVGSAEVHCILAHGMGLAGGVEANAGYG